MASVAPEGSKRATKRTAAPKRHKDKRPAAVPRAQPSTESDLLESAKEAPATGDAAPGPAIESSGAIDRSARNASDGVGSASSERHPHPATQNIGETDDGAHVDVAVPASPLAETANGDHQTNAPDSLHRAACGEDDVNRRPDERPLNEKGVMDRADELTATEAASTTTTTDDGNDGGNGTRQPPDAPVATLPAASPVSTLGAAYPLIRTVGQLREMERRAAVLLDAYYSAKRAWRSCCPPPSDPDDESGVGWRAYVNRCTFRLWKDADFAIALFRRRPGEEDDDCQKTVAAGGARATVRGRKTRGTVRAGGRGKESASRTRPAPPPTLPPPRRKQQVSESEPRLLHGPTDPQSQRRDHMAAVTTAPAAPCAYHGVPTTTTTGMDRLPPNGFVSWQSAPTVGYAVDPAASTSVATALPCGGWHPSGMPAFAVWHTGGAPGLGARAGFDNRGAADGMRVWSGAEGGPHAPCGWFSSMPVATFAPATTPQPSGYCDGAMLMPCVASCHNAPRFVRPPSSDRRMASADPFSHRPTASAAEVATLDRLVPAGQGADGAVSGDSDGWTGKRGKRRARASARPPGLHLGKAGTEATNGKKYASQAMCARGPQ